ncbi:MAG TPA: polyprenyl synthetase family protein, partial [Thermoanaerobaculia bacterium]|nr:polyprenyl synthetase family protein [Thermoanaerobaculia bacterium]
AVAIVASAIGLSGMAGGQALDLAATGAGAAPEGQANRLREIHAKKTGRLLSVSLELGALLAGADRQKRDAVAGFGDVLGLVFQIADDLLDVTASSATLGKTAGKDAAQAKLTYPAVFGLDGAKRELERALDEARSRAEALGDRSGLLVSLAEYAAKRDR